MNRPPISDDDWWNLMLYQMAPDRLSALDAARAYRLYWQIRETLRKELGVV